MTDTNQEHELVTRLRELELVAMEKREEYLHTVGVNIYTERAIAFRQAKELAAQVLSAPETQTQSTTEWASYWLISRPGGPNDHARWWHPRDGWMIDPAKGIRFCRREDADAYKTSMRFGGGSVVEEHQDVKARVPPETQTKPTTEEDVTPYKDALYDLVMCRAEQLAIGGGPGWKEREAKAWRAAEELFEP